MRTIHVSPDFPLNRRMRKDIRRGKLQVVREGGERLSLGGGIPSGKGRGFRTTGSPLVCMADNGAEVGGGLGEIGFEIERQNAREIFDGRVQFRVPIFQRDYVWEEEQWEDFWADVNGSKPQYVGGVVLRDDGRGRFEVIDGQQRLTTVCLFVIAALRVLHTPQENSGFGLSRSHDICKELANAFLFNGGKLDGDIGRMNMKVIPHDPQWDGAGEFLSKLMKIHPATPPTLSQPGGEFHPYIEHGNRGNTPAIQMKKSVQLFFMGKLFGLGLTTPEEMRDFVLDRMGDNLVFSRVVAARNEGAHAIFETLNGRGRALTPAELIKCYFMSFLDDVEAKDFDGEWNDIRKLLDGAGTTGDGSKKRGNSELVGFIWAVYTCKFGAVPRQRLFREIAKRIRDKSEMLGFFETMREQIKTYVQILDPNPGFWGNEFHKVDGLRHCSPRVSKGRSPFIMAAYSHKAESPGAFSEALEICVAVAVRLKMCGHPSGVDHNLPGFVFNQLAHKIWNADQFSVEDVLGDGNLPNLYHKRGDFEESFEKFTLPANNGRLTGNQLGFVGYALRMLEAGIGGQIKRLNDRQPNDYVIRSYGGNNTRHRLSEYCLRAKQGEATFLTTERTAQMHCDERGRQLGKWATEVRDWRINRFEDQ